MLEPCQNFKNKKEKRKKETPSDTDFERVSLVPVFDTCQTWVLGQKCRICAA